VTNATRGSQDSTDSCQYGVNDNAPILFRLFTHNCLIRILFLAKETHLNPPLDGGLLTQSAWLGVSAESTTLALLRRDDYLTLVSEYSK
jgi:hypothetical protein